MAIIVGISAHVFVRIVDIKKNIVDDSVIACEKIITIKDSLSKNVTKTLPTNLRNIWSKTSNERKLTCEKK